MLQSGIAVPRPCGIKVKVDILAVDTVDLVPRGMYVHRGPVIMVRYGCTCAEWACAWAIDGTRGRGIFL